MKKDKFFSESKEVEILIKSARIASTKAKRISKALGLSIMETKGNYIIEKFPNGKEVKIKKIEKVKSKIPNLKKGSIICLNPKD